MHSRRTTLIDGRLVARRAAPRTHHNASIDEGAASVLCDAPSWLGQLGQAVTLLRRRRAGYAADAWLGQPLDELVHHNNTSHGRLGPPARRRDIGAAV